MKRKNYVSKDVGTERLYVGMPIAQKQEQTSIA